MPFQKIRQYIIQKVSEDTQNESLDFGGVFSEVLQHPITHEEGVILLMILAPHVISGFYENILSELYPEGGEFPQFGGIKADNYRSMQPTGETIQYILAGTDIQKRIVIQRYLNSDHWFYKEQILHIDSVQEGMPFMSGKLILSQETIDLLLYGKMINPRFSADFPAKELNTKMSWSDLVLNQITFQQINQLQLWIKHNQTLRKDWGMDKRLAPGYKVLFCGPSGTGKTLTATLLAKEYNRPVYRVDLSQVVSKYIGETEKILEKIFNKAENKNWVLFFDEADALFGKRTTTRSAQDRFANQGVSYLLQRIEYFNGILILASNYKNNIDKAFLRRFNTIVMFKKPNPTERLKLWKISIPNKINTNLEILEKIANNYELTGAQIANIVAYSCLLAAEDKTTTLTTINLLNAIKNEFQKEEKIFNNKISI